MPHQLIDRGNALVCEHSLLHFRGWEIATFQAAVRSIIATKPELVEKNTFHFNSAGESSSYEVHYFGRTCPEISCFLPKITSFARPLNRQSHISIQLQSQVLVVKSPFLLVESHFC